MVKHNGTDDSSWQYQMKCSDIPIAVIIGATIGSFFALCLVLLITAVIVVNVNDYRQYQNYLKNKEMNVKHLAENVNPLFGDPNQKIENPEMKEGLLKLIDAKCD